MSKYSVISTRLMPIKPTVMDRVGARIKLFRRLRIALVEWISFVNISVVK